jgi:chemotaxis protein MotA
MAKQKVKTARGRRRPDLASWAGVAIAVGGILFGFHLEHGRPEFVVGPSAALIVLGGCIGATLVATPLPVARGALSRLKDIFFSESSDNAQVMEDLIRYATHARKTGLVSLETEANEIPDPFLRKALTLAVDGADIQEIRSMMELEIHISEQRAEKEAKVYEAAGGFAPTIGIIGAVLGLILVMRSLGSGDMTEIGKGIATAFIATIYGVGIANLFLLPAATKIKMAAHHQAERQELVLEGVCGIVEGLNPKLLRLKLEAFAPAPGGRAKRPADAPRPETAAEEQD